MVPILRDISSPVFDYSNMKPASYINNVLFGTLDSSPAEQYVSDLSSLDYAVLNFDYSKEPFYMGHWSSNTFVYKPLNKPERLITPTKEASEMPEYGSEILLCTGSRGVITGTSLNSSSSLRFGVSKYMMKTWKCSFHRIVQGDCGSWAINPRTSELLGMLVGNCTALSEAYIVPAKDILSHIRQIVRTTNVKLPQHSLHREIVAASTNADWSIQARMGYPNPVLLAAKSLLYDAVVHADAVAVKRCIDCGSDVNLGRDLLDLQVRSKRESGDFPGLELERLDHFKPLYFAIMSRNLPIVKCLVESGADLDNLTRSMDSMTAEDVEREKPHSQIRTILINKRREARGLKGPIVGQASREYQKDRQM